MNKFRILVLDGGGSKGIYTLGVLKELEMKLGKSLWKHFDLIYGTSTGSIIGSLIALGKDVDTIKSLYLKYIPEIMQAWGKGRKSALLKDCGEKVFGTQTFGDFRTNIGIVALNLNTQEPIIFKNNKLQAHGMKHSFEEGFGCTISEAVQCSCSAYPVFDIKKIKTTNKGDLDVIDGGYIANNAILYALIDAHKAFGRAEEDIQVLSIGVGNYIDKPLDWKWSILKRTQIMKLIEKVLATNSNSNVKMAKLLYPNLSTVRISDTFNEPEYGTNLIEADADKLEKLYNLGKRSYATHEKELNEMFKG